MVNDYVHQTGRLGKNARLSGEICASTGSGKKNMSHGKGIVSDITYPPLY